MMVTPTTFVSVRVAGRRARGRSDGAVRQGGSQGGRRLEGPLQQEDQALQEEAAVEAGRAMTRL